MSPQEIENFFPALKSEAWKPTSVETSEYNCFAWAANDTGRKWDPDENSKGRFWRDDVSRNLELESFLTLYKKECGFVPCNNGDLEEGFEKIAIYLNFNQTLQKHEVTHAARQLPSGKWTSKLGDFDDIEHSSVVALDGVWYGTVAKYMKRPISK